jgi:plasmid maintenance system antidote protein VapI
MVNERGGNSSEMATRLEKAIAASVDLWRRPHASDLACARQYQHEVKVVRYEARGGAGA